MTYEELVEKARAAFGAADASGIEGHVAYQFNITGEAAELSTWRSAREA